MAVERDGYRGTGIPIKLGRTPGRVRATPPAYGEGNRAVLAKAGYGEAEIDALVRAGVVLDAPRKAM